LHHRLTRNLIEFNSKLKAEFVKALVGVRLTDLLEKIKLDNFDGRHGIRHTSAVKRSALLLLLLLLLRRRRRRRRRRSRDTITT
jgi:hypothetical protein